MRSLADVPDGCYSDAMELLGRPAYCRLTFGPWRSVGDLTTTYEFTTYTKETEMTKRDERIEKCKQKVIAEARRFARPGPASSVADAVRELESAEASGAPSFGGLQDPKTALVAARRLLRHLLHDPDFSRGLAEEWLEELEAR